MEKPEMREMGHFGSKIDTFEFFSKSIYQVFLKLYLITGIKKGLK